MSGSAGVPADVLDQLLPGGEGFPAASAIGLSDRIRANPRLSAAWDAVLPHLDGRADDDGLREVEAAHPGLFGAAVVAAYSAYYTAPEVLAVIEAKTGYTASPPQPEGYRLAAFDPAMLAEPSSRAALWRDPREATERSEP